MLQRHTHRGTKSLFLREPQFSIPQFEEDVMIWDVTLDNVGVSGEVDTFYWCQIFRAPSVNRKTHVIGFIPVIDEENFEEVHHMILYECHLPDSNKHYEQYLHFKGQQCFAPTTPSSWASCWNPIITWAVGNEGEIFPDHVGFPLGEEYGGATYFKLEMHYDNPNFRKDIVDSSGLHVFLTEKLRQFDAGFLALGHVVEATQIIPPGRLWKTTTYCDSGCLAQALPSEGVKAFKALLHTHTLGKNITVRQLREGRELPNVFKDMNYDFNYQQSRVLKEELSILPGDSFIIECGYDSTFRKTPTFGGVSTKEEMCQAFVSYYPRISVSRCTSSPEISQIYTSLGVQEVDNQWNSVRLLRKERLAAINDEKSKENSDTNDTVAVTELTKMYKYIIATEPKRMADRSMYDILYDPNTWQDDQVVSKLQQHIAYGPKRIACTDVAHHLFRGYPKILEFPDFETTDYIDEECNANIYEDEESTKTRIPKESSRAIACKCSSAILSSSLILIGIFHLKFGS